LLGNSSVFTLTHAVLILLHEYKVLQPKWKFRAKWANTNMASLYAKSWHI